MSAPSNTSPAVQPSSELLAAAIAAATDGVGLVEDGRLVLANRALLRALGEPSAADLDGAASRASPLSTLLEWLERERASERAEARLSLGTRQSDVSAWSLDLPGSDSRAVFAAVAADGAPEFDAIARFVALASSLAALRVPRPLTRELVRNLVAFAPAVSETHGSVDVNAVLQRVLTGSGEPLLGHPLIVPHLGRVPRVRATESRLGHALWNLIANALDAFATKPGVEPRVVVTTRSDAERVIVEVSDTGVGIAELDVERVFEPFFTTKAVGAGLGLSVSRHIVNALGGELDARSQHGEGSALRVSLPAAEKRTSTLPPPGGGARLLIIDDEPLLGQTLKFAFSRRHDVVVASSGREALRLLAESASYDLVLCDLMMPDVPGQKVFEAVERDHAELLPRFFFMTGGAFTESAQDFLERHPDRRIDKPFTIADIEGLLAKIR